jgi:hypothetical protein
MSAGHARWASLAGQDVQATDDSGSTRSIHLAAVSPARAANGWIAYTLTFRADADFPAEQQTYQLTGAGVDEPVFLVPLTRDGTGLALEAVFAQAHDEEDR